MIVMLNRTVAFLLFGAMVWGCHGGMKRINKIWDMMQKVSPHWMPPPPMARSAFPGPAPPKFRHHSREPRGFAMAFPNFGSTVPMAFLMSFVPVGAANNQTPQSQTPAASQPLAITNGHQQNDTNSQAAPSSPIAPIDQTIQKAIQSLLSNDSPFHQIFTEIKTIFEKHQQLIEMKDQAKQYETEHKALSEQIEDLKKFKEDVSEFKYFEKEAESLTGSIQEILSQQGLVAAPSIDDVLVKIKDTINNSQVFNGEWDGAIDKAISDLSMQHMFQNSTLLVQSVIVGQIENISEKFKDLWGELVSVFEGPVPEELDQIQAKINAKIKEITAKADAAQNALDPQLINRLKSLQSTLETSRQTQLSALQKLKTMEDGLNDTKQSQTDTVKNWIKSANSTPTVATNSQVKDKLEKLRTMFVEAE